MKKSSSLFSLFDQFPNIGILLSEKTDGGMKIRYDLEKDEKTLRNRKLFFSQYAITETQVVVAKLVQENNVKTVTQKEGIYISQTDGLLTQEKDLFLSITIADCLPIYLYESHKKVIGILHAGWKGLEKEIIDNAMDVLRTTYNASPEKLIVGIGPGIGICHFAVHHDVLDRFSKYHNVSEKRNNKYFLDLKKIAKQQFIKNNVPQKNIEIHPLCTYCEKNRYFSYRREASQPIQAMVASIGMRDF